VRSRLVAVAVAVVLVALALPAIALAHATLVRTVPANGASVGKAPREVRVVFDDVVRVGPGVEAIRNGGGSVLAGSAHVEGQRTLVVPLRPGLRKGAYSVRWSIVSDDGHLESGVIAFAVGTGATPTAALTAEATGPQAADVIARWLFYAGLLVAVGASFFALVARSLESDRIALLLSTSAVIAAVGAGDEAHRIGLDTRAGAALGAAALLAVVVATLAGAATLERRLLRPAVLLAPLLVLPPALGGHADDRGVNRINIVADALHVAGAAAWVGALLGFVVFRDAPRRRAAALALGGVLLLAVTGVVRAWSELLRVAQLWDTSYGRTLLVKTGGLLLALAGGWLLRARIRRRAGFELVLVAGIVVAVSVLVLLRPGRNVVAAALPLRVSTAEPAPAPPLPAPGAVVLAKELGDLGVALQLEPRRTIAIVLSPAGGGLSGLDVHLNGTAAKPCGSGCYRTDEAPGTSVEVQVDRFGPTLRTRFPVPQTAVPANRLMQRFSTQFRGLRSVSYLERLASSPSQVVTALWRLERPNRVSYQIPGGAAGIVIGARRWDRSTPDAAWQASQQTPLVQPATLWSSTANAHVISARAGTKTLTFLDPATPAYFAILVDAKTLLPRTVHMTASAHFMVDRYLRFNAPRAIYPPR
jgi:copper transport protein